MPNVILRPDWHLPERHVTPEREYLRRRDFLRHLGLAGIGLAAAFPSGALGQTPATGSPFPSPRNTAFAPGSPLTPERLALTYNNFYEFSTTKDRVHRLVDRFQVKPWKLEISGLCEKPMSIDIDELLRRHPHEERVYRFRCVEAWSMVVPWTGFPLSRLLQEVQPKSEARFVRFQTAVKPAEMPGIGRLSDYPWPYTEGLRIDEAMNPLVLLATGLYGKPMPKQNGAPVRLVVPWKYGFKSIKSIVRIELVDRQPATLWETLSPREYPFESNVDPAVPYPRWSQATERVLGSGDRIPTLKYNGYADQVAHLYPGA